MRKFLFGVSIFLMLPFIGCEDNKADDTEGALQIIEVTTDNVSDGPYYFNLVTGKKDASTWHIVYQNLDVPFGNSVYQMPSIALSTSSMLNIDSNNEFESITTYPDASTFAPEAGRMQYGGPNTALSYDMAIHKVGVSDDSYIIYDTVTQKVFKVHFDEYSGGIVIFRYAELID
jgi:hypothetical protein